MTGADLAAEYLTALRRTGFGDLWPLRAAGVGGIGISTAPAALRISVSPDRLYQPDPEGRPAFILPVRVASPVTPESVDPLDTIRDGAIVDLCAIDPRHPYKWALRLGVAEWLGSIPPQFMPPCPPVRIRRCPLSWLQADCDGLVMLQPFSGPGHRILMLCDVLEAEDHDHARLIRAALEHPWPVPPVRAGDGRRETRHAA